MINEYYIIGNANSVKPLVQVWINNHEEFLPLAVYGVKDHATIKSQNKMKAGVIHTAQICRISLKGDVANKLKPEDLRLI